VVGGQHREVKFKGWPRTKEGTKTPGKTIGEQNWIPGNGVGFPPRESNFLFSTATEVMYIGCRGILPITSTQRGNWRFVELNLCSLEAFMGKCLIQRRDRFIMQLEWPFFRNILEKFWLSVTTFAPFWNVTLSTWKLLLMLYTGKNIVKLTRIFEIFVNVSLNKENVGRLYCWYFYISWL